MAAQEEEEKKIVGSNSWQLAINQLAKGEGLTKKWLMKNGKR